MQRATFSDFLFPRTPTAPVPSSPPPPPPPPPGTVNSDVGDVKGSLNDLLLDPIPFPFCSSQSSGITLVTNQGFRSPIGTVRNQE